MFALEPKNLGNKPLPIDELNQHVEVPVEYPES